MGNPGATWNLAIEKMLSRDQMAQVLALAKERSQRNYVFWLTQANTGFRLCEVAHIRRSDVLPGSRIRVTRRKKKALGPMSIDMMPSAWAVLNEWAQRVELNDFVFPGGSAPCILTRSKLGVKQEPQQLCEGGHIHLRTIQLQWRLTMERAGIWIPGRGVHQTRHFFGTELYNKTRDLRLTQVALGHSSSSMTERYAHVTEFKEKLGTLEAIL